MISTIDKAMVIDHIPDSSPEKLAPFSISIIKGDITQQRVDAIVNAANRSLLGGGGVDGAIHTAAGSELLTACEQLNGCETGDAKITPGFLLPAKFIIHTVGPIFANYSEPEARRLLESCYKRCLEIAEQYNLQDIAFSSIATGAYGYPYVDAARIALSTIISFQNQSKSLREIRLVLLHEKSAQNYREVAAELGIPYRDAH